MKGLNEKTMRPLLWSRTQGSSSSEGNLEVRLFLEFCRWRLVATLEGRQYAGVLGSAG